jgi:dipeptidase E
MKLLLTSNGFSNQAIADALFDLVGKKAEDISLVFIPTASNIESGDKEWLIDDLINIKNQNFKSVAITDISAVPENIWRPQLEEADILFFEGGNTYHLMKWVNDSGLANLLPEMLKTKVYVGLSAGSMITGPDLNIGLSKSIYGEKAREESVVGLGFTDFYFLPHLNNPHFSNRIEANLAKAMEEIKVKTYVLDDYSALKVTDGKVEHVGGGKYLEFN